MKARWLALAIVAACGGGGGFPDAFKAEKAPDPGTFAIDWTLTDSSGSATTCAVANASNVRVGIVDESNPNSESTVSFPCTLLGGVTSALFAGTYDLNFTLLGSDGATSISTSATQTGLAIVSDKTTAVTPVVFSVTTN